jgi:outer membrane protein, heavy metal efflux system
MKNKPFILLLAIGFFGAAAAESAAQTPQGAPPTDLLRDVRTRPAMELSQFEEFALANNPTVQEMTSLVRQSAGLAKQAGLFPNPSIGYQGEQIRGGSYRGGEQGAFVQQTFVLGGKLALRRKVYEQQRKEGEIGVQEQRYRVLGDIRRQFYATLTAQELASVREQLMQLANDAVETAHQLANVGQADAPDVLQSEVEAEQAKLEYTTAQRSFLQQFAILAALAGKPDLEPLPLKGDLGNVPNIDLTTTVSQFMQSSPSVKRAQQAVAVSEAEVKSARREGIPDLQIHAGVQNNFEPLAGRTNAAVGVQAFVTAGITLPIFNRNQGNVAAAEAGVERAQAELTRIRLSLQQAAKPVIQEYFTAQEQERRYRTEMIPRAKRAYQLYLTKYQQMASAYPQVLLAQRTLFQLQVAYLGVLQQLWSDATALNNFLLSNGLTAPQNGGGAGARINLPNAGVPGEH